MNHELKTHPAPFAATLAGAKTFEIRSTLDRDFNVGDVLQLREYDPEATPENGMSKRVFLAMGADGPGTVTYSAYTGRRLDVEVTHGERGPAWGLPEWLCVMSIRRIP